MMEQNRLTKISIGQAETQWKTQNRPWVGVSGSVELPQQLMFLSFVGKPSPYAGIKLTMTFKMRNYGLSPAFKAASGFEILLTGNILDPPQQQMVSACSYADGDGQKGGSVIFPNSEIGPTWDQESDQPIGLPQIQRVWILGCIAYQDLASKVIRHTKFWIVSYMLQDNVRPTLLRHELRGDVTVDLFSLPVRGWNILKTEAD